MVHYEWQKVLYDTANVIFTARVIPRVVKSRHNIVESVSCVGGQSLQEFLWENQKAATRKTRVFPPCPI